MATENQFRDTTKKMRLIDANAIKYREHRGGGGREYPENIVTEDEIAKMPTVDAVEVVRCKECKRWRRVYDNSGTCELYELNPDIYGVNGDGFCSYGERRTNV